MSNRPARQAIFAALFNAVLVASAFLLPRLSAGRSDGFAGAAAAALLFGALMLAALLTGVVTAIVTYRSARRLSLPMPWVAGIAPLAIFALGVAGMAYLVAAKAG